MLKESTLSDHHTADINNVHLDDSASLLVFSNPTQHQNIQGLDLRNTDWPSAYPLLAVFSFLLGDRHTLHRELRTHIALPVVQRGDTFHSWEGNFVVYHNYPRNVMAANHPSILREVRVHLAQSPYSVSRPRHRHLGQAWRYKRIRDCSGWIGG